MDSITHIFLGAAIAQATACRRTPSGRAIGWKTAFLLGGLAATLPDFDVFIRTGDTVTDHALHRSFMHALVFVPVLAFVATIPFLVWKRLQEQWRAIYLAAFLATLSHPLLDSLTSYGTQLLWPFSSQRFAFDLIAVIDVTYTTILIAGVFLAWRKHNPRIAQIALLLSMLYLGVALVQHQRAVDAQRQILALRGHGHAENPRVLPEIGAVLNYRSIYTFDGRIYADAVRVPLLGAPRLKTGGSVSAAANAPVDATAALQNDFTTFRWFADGYIAPDPSDPSLLADMRYTGTLEGFDPVWAVRLQNDRPPVWELFPSRRYASRIWNDLFRPRGYLSFPPSPS